MKAQPIILFDGVCNFCNGAVNFIIKRDKKSTLKFAAIQSSLGQQILNDYHLPSNFLSSFVFIHKGHLYTQSTAALKVCKYLDGLWPLFYGFIIVPKFIRDAIYKLIAKNRYRWFGRKDQCMVPDAGVRHRFL